MKLVFPLLELRNYDLRIATTSASDPTLQNSELLTVIWKHSYEQHLFENSILLENKSAYYANIVSF